jgi:hypothetical protein
MARKTGRGHRLLDPTWQAYNEATDEAKGTIDGFEGLAFRDEGDRSSSGDNGRAIIRDGSIPRYVIPASNWDQFEAEFKKLAKLAKRVGVEAPEWTVAGTLSSYIYGEVTPGGVADLRAAALLARGDDPYADLNHHKPVNSGIDGDYRLVAIGEDQEQFIVDVTGPVARFAGWQFAGTIHRLPTEEGAEFILSQVPGLDITLPDRFRPGHAGSTSHDWCDHCGKRRTRANTYVLVHEDGRVAQVGSTCIKAFLGVASPDAIASWLEWYSKGTHEFAHVRHSHETGFATDYWLAQAACVIRHKGWVSRSSSDYGKEPTSGEVLRYLERRHGFDVQPVGWVDLKPEQADYDLADAAIAWGRAGGPAGDEFGDKLTQASKATVAIRAVRGLLAYLPVAYTKGAQQRAVAAVAGPVSAPQGVAGEKLTRTVTVLECRGFQSQFGDGKIVKLKDEQGNLYVWFTTVEAPRLNATATVTGTVKGHKEFKGITETQLTRVTLVKGQAWK